MVLVDVCVITCHRLVYLKRCINSILETAPGINIHVISDTHKELPPDGTNNYLIRLKNKGLIKTLITNKENLGSAQSHNKIISKTSGKFFVITNDDMKFKPGWMQETFRIYGQYQDAATVTFFNYTRRKQDLVRRLDDVDLVTKTGLACTLVNRDAFIRAGGFVLPNGKAMGFFATKLCLKISALSIRRNRHYLTSVPFAIHMDLPSNSLSSRDQLKEYSLFRTKHKKGFAKK